jgi:hypothetical protein
MKKVKRVLLYTGIAIILVIIIAISYITLALPNVGDPENISIALTTARIYTQLSLICVPLNRLLPAILTKPISYRRFKYINIYIF